MRGCPMLFHSFMRWRSQNATAQGRQALFRGGRGALESEGHGKYGVKEAYNGLVVIKLATFRIEAVG
ncbi:hypothetical protein CK203_026841 [Vitis vinifera]|uniref:Uncharacterized protein n=1 Tax=Vitis vinifera TaxID=29760 RepID=A0A438IP29_VITVI|nr:hypothetical protein CK203_026841 [Vitis vinifera]